MLTDKSIRHIIRQLKKCRVTRVVAEEMKVPQRHVQRLWAEYLGAGTAHIQGKAGRPKGADPSDDEVKMCWTPTLFESELLSLDIGLINSRPYHPQTNGKLERFHRSIEDEIWRYGCLDDYIEYYTDRPHWALDIDNYETPMMAFHNKAATDDARRQDPKWMEADING